MNENDVFTIINKQDGNLAFKLLSFSDNSYFDYLQRNNFYTVVWIKQGTGILKVDFSEYSFRENCLCTFSPYQPFMFLTDGGISGIALQFHSDFYCIHRNPRETNCDSVLFNNIYQAPFFEINKSAQSGFSNIISQLKAELKNTTNDNFELLIPNLKIFLVTASRLKMRLTTYEPALTDGETPLVLRSLKDAIENNYKEKHSASEYANILNISASALAKLVKIHYNKTLTNLITERIIIEAKRELYMTSKPIKEIAWDLGYADEFYFSRVFKTNADISPQFYRDTVGFGKSEMS